MSEITTDTQTLREIISGCHLKCNKEADIATLSTKVNAVETKVDKMDEKLDRIDKYISKSQGEKNIIMGIIGLGAGLIGSWISKN